MYQPIHLHARVWNYLLVTRNTPCLYSLLHVIHLILLIKLVNNLVAMTTTIRFYPLLPVIQLSWRLILTNFILSVDLMSVLVTLPGGSWQHPHHLTESRGEIKKGNVFNTSHWKWNHSSDFAGLVRRNKGKEWHVALWKAMLIGLAQNFQLIFFPSDTGNNVQVKILTTHSQKFMWPQARIRPHRKMSDFTLHNRGRCLVILRAIIIVWWEKNAKQISSWRWIY